MSAHKMIAILFSLFLIGISGTVCAQTFSSLPESERNAKLIEVAKYVYKNPQWQNFYREYGTPEIESFVREGVGRESMEWDYAAKVYISDKGGMAYAIALGNGIIFKFYEMKKNPIE